MNSRRLASAALVVFALVGCDAAPPPFSPLKVQRGPGADDLEIWPDEFPRARVFLFVRTDCPIANRYAPEIMKLHEQFCDVAEFVLVYASPRESTSQIEAHTTEFYAQQIPALRDAQHSLVAHMGVSVTPEAVVYNKDKRMLYRGRIDDRYVDFGVTRAHPTERDLHDVLTAIQEDKQVAFRESKAVGCYISAAK